MNIKNRLKKIESGNAQAFDNRIKEAAETEICEHPASMFELYRDYPAKGHSDSRLVTKGHCNACGFDDYLWSFYALTDEQEERRWELKYKSAFWESKAYDLELLEAGLISYTLFPPSPEVQTRLTERVKV